MDTHHPSPPPSASPTSASPASSPATASVPVRVQLSRRKGWRKPANCTVVARPTKWGNPFVVGRASSFGPVPDAATSVAYYRRWLSTPAGKMLLAAAKRELRGQSLACWCRPGTPCHADVLLAALLTQ